MTELVSCANINQNQLNSTSDNLALDWNTNIGALTYLTSRELESPKNLLYASLLKIVIVL